MTALWYICGVLIGYLLGNINTAAILARIKGFDIRGRGSGNAGASNALVTMGKGAAVCSALVDILKAFLPVWLLLHVIPLPEGCSHLPVLVGIAVILGHMFPFWMQFRGGKGFASLLGFSLAIDWRFFLVCIAILAILLLTTRYIALATIACAAALPVWHGIGTRDWLETVLLSVLAVVIISKHIQNLRRMKDGTEIKLGEKHKKEADT
ncbi:MAG TPA: acyl-phosphate glycerol 3-phosphate acyltransferase [Ruminococcus sp.]|nr:acyl-phosphate glycerol 3-phosphate acyltransferase [Ruminococcus sp.]